MRIVITGASGNVGTALLRRLRGHGHDLSGVCRRPPGAVEPYDGVRWTSIDMADPDVDAVTEALRPVVRGADAVVHLAWGFQPSRDVAYLERLGVGGTAAVIAAVSAEHVGHLVHMSSVGAYSPGGRDRVTEAWPTEGVASLPYSRHKVAAERLLDEFERTAGGTGEGAGDGTAVARMRPGVILQRGAASALLRYGLPAFVPSGILRHVPLLPVDRGLAVPVVHTDDVADAIARVLERRATGAFNLAAEPPVTRDLIAEVLGAPAVHLPKSVLRLVADLAWRIELQPLDPGWIDLAFATPLLDCTRARRELEWSPAIDARTALTQVVDAMADSAAGDSPVLRQRTVADEITALLRRGNVATRRLP